MHIHTISEYRIISIHIMHIIVLYTWLLKTSSFAELFHQCSSALLHFMKWIILLKMMSAPTMVSYSRKPLISHHVE